jgi:tRNA threonylcarbamoyladenosine biosynthesis protein TsaB
MPRILAIDTTAEFGSVAVFTPEREASEISLHSPDGFGHILFDNIAAVLQRHSCALSDIDCFASASGPGSFTGVRVGLTAAKGLAEAMRRPIVAVSNLKAVASFGAGPLRATVIDARRGEIYGAVYDDCLRPVQDERVTGFPVWLDGLPEGVEFIGWNLAPFLPAIEASRFGNAPVIEAPRSLAAAIARIAHNEFTHGRALDPSAADANYVRRSDAELFWKEV